MLSGKLILGLFLLADMAHTESLLRIGQVIAVTGTVTVQRQGLAIALAAQDLLYADDVVTTGTDGTADLKLQDQTTMFLRSKSRLRLIQFGGIAALAQAALHQGKLLVRTGTDAVAIATPTAVVRAAHTRFAVEVP